jgi:hypothetical protein
MTLKVNKARIDTVIVYRTTVKFSVSASLGEHHIPPMNEVLIFKSSAITTEYYHLLYIHFCNSNELLKPLR